jgi:hypothetical protein
LTSHTPIGGNNSLLQIPPSQAKLEFASRKPFWLAGFALVLVLLQLIGGWQRVSAAVPTMIFCNGDMGSAAGLTPSQISGLRASGMNTMVVFTMGVATNGDFTYGGVICSNGVYVGPSNWGALLNQCRTQPSSITRIEMCIGAWGDPSWTNIKNLIAANGTNANTVLFQNLLALKNALGIDAICNDDESAYDSASAIKFGQMCGSVGLKLTLCPYTNPSYWQAVKAGLGNICDQVYLQCYDGGAGNNPATWNTYFGGLKVVPGYWDWERDTTFVDKMKTWKSVGAVGGFYWPSCTGCNPPADANGMKQYAGWIQNTFNSGSQPVTAVDVVGGGITFTASSFVGADFSYQWQVIKSGTTNNIPGATNLSLALNNLQLTNAAAYQLRASNLAGILYSSASTLTVSSVPAPVNNIVTTYAAQTGFGYGFPFTPTWTLAPSSAIQGQTATGASGDYSLESQWGTRNVNALTAGDSLTVNTGGNPLTTSTNYITCGNGSGAGSALIYSFTNSSPFGFNITNITVYGGWRDAGRDQQAYTIYYSTVASPSSYVLLGSVNYNPANAAGAHSATRAMLARVSGFLVTNAAALKFDFTSPASENSWCGYTEITVSGVSVSPTIVADTMPVTAADVVGSQVVFTAGVNGSSPLTCQWQKISGGATNSISDATNVSLTLNNLQLSDAGSYRLLVTNAYGVAHSTARTLTVNSVPAPVNNVIVSLAAQTGVGSGTFVPTWTMATNGSLVAGQNPSSMSGDFSKEALGRNVTSLTAGDGLGLREISGVSELTTDINYVTCGNGSGAGSSVTYTLIGSSNGYNLTNITVYGGWKDAGRDQQAYTVYYSKVAAPATFISLGSVNYNPANASNAQSATRISLIPATGVLATNVAAVKFDFTTPGSENGYCGYTEIVLSGSPTPVVVPVATNPTNIAFQFAANYLTLSWPSDHIGWRLQVQTNDLAQGLGTNWVDVPGSTSTNQMNISISPVEGAVFFRLIYP